MAQLAEIKNSKLAAHSSDENKIKKKDEKEEKKQEFKLLVQSSVNKNVTPSWKESINAYRAIEFAQRDSDKEMIINRMYEKLEGVAKSKESYRALIQSHFIALVMKNGIPNGAEPYLLPYLSLKRSKHMLKSKCPVSLL